MITLQRIFVLSQSPTSRRSENAFCRISIRERNISCVAFLTLLICSILSFSADAKNLGWPGTTLSGVGCYGGIQGYGPYNYVTQKSKLTIVERHHFTPWVEQLIRGESATIMGDLDYTLRAFPNHHRALLAVSRYYLDRVEKNGDMLLQSEREQSGHPPPECYFNRAKKFAPQDGVVQAIFGTYLHKRGKLDVALSEYTQAEEKLPEYSELIYNMGLLYLELNEITKAKEYADRAAELGYPLPGLSRRISRIKENAKER